MRERASERVRSVGANICAYNTTAARAECVRRKQHRTGQAGSDDVTTATSAAAAAAPRVYAQSLLLLIRGPVIFHRACK